MQMQICSCRNGTIMSGLHDKILEHRYGLRAQKKRSHTRWISCSNNIEVGSRQDVNSSEICTYKLSVEAFGFGYDFVSRSEKAIFRRNFVNFRRLAFLRSRTGMAHFDWRRACHRCCRNCKVPRNRGKFLNVGVSSRWTFKMNGPQNKVMRLQLLPTFDSFD